MIDKIGKHRSGDFRRIEDRTDGDRLMHRVVVTEPAPARAPTPSDFTNFQLIVKISPVNFPRNLLQGMVRSCQRVDPLSTALSASSANRRFYIWILSKGVINLHHASRRTAAQNLARQQGYDRLQNQRGGILTMIADPNSPGAAFPAYGVCETDVGVEGGHNICFLESRRRRAQHLTAYRFELVRPSDLPTHHCVSCRCSYIGGRRYPRRTGPTTPSRARPAAPYRTHE